jgi:hypothetical protein
MIRLFSLFSVNGLERERAEDQIVEKTKLMTRNFKLTLRENRKHCVLGE